MKKNKTAVKLKAFRKSLGLTQVQFAKKLKVSQSMVSQMERGTYAPFTLPFLRKAAKLSTSPAEVYADLVGAGVGQ
jgi:transcriptional regulator with XRE-family HTH domain